MDSGCLRFFAVLSAFKRGDWNTCRIKCKGSKLKTGINGMTTTDVEDATDASEVIAIQHHGEMGRRINFATCASGMLK